jgi:phospholipid/cholesterol/gamma-HCH transport system substrate-binding protein
MKNQKAINFRVGLFVLIAIGIFSTIVFFLSGEQSYFEKSYTLKTSFKNTAGLIKGAAVRLSGVRIGAVTDLGFASDPVGDKVINVTMLVNKEGMSRLNPDSKATIKTEGLLGDKFIEILPGEEPPLAKLPDILTIQSETPIEFASIIGQSGDLLTNIISISESLDKIVKGIGEGKNLDNINQTIASVKASSEALQRNMEAIEKGNGILNTMIYGPKDKSGQQIDENTLIKLNKTVAKLDTLLNQINNGDGAIHALVYDEKLTGEVDTTLTNLSASSVELKETMANFNEISEMLRGGEGTLGALIIDPSIYDNLKGILGEAERSKFVRAAVRYLVDQEQVDGTGESTPN